MQKHLEDVLTASGLSADQVKALVELPENAPDFKTDAYVAPIQTAVQTKITNDPKFYEGLNRENLPKEFVKILENEQYGRAATIVRTNMLKAVGLKEDDFKDLGEEGKKIEIFTPAFAKKLSEGKVNDKQLQEKLFEATTEIEKLKGQGTELETKYKTQADQQIADFQFSASVLGTLAAVPGLKAPAKYLNSDIVTQLRGKYAFEVKDGAVQLMQKANPTLKAMTADNKELTLSAAILGILEADQLIDKKAVTTTTTTTKVEVEPAKGGLKISKNVDDKIKNRMEQDKKLASS